ncbi:DUF3048 domain-containing protein [Bacillus sp. 2205SS5-2]|uniref:DUF3048 domain-containing protein n=1 Tax=Bacillus sp. 2205SS5-2 TaxID=3109031 RepID=UPI003006AFCC
MRKKAAVFIGVIMFLTACGDNETTMPQEVGKVEEISEQNTSITKNDVEEKETVSYTYPLTGVKTETPSSNRAITVTVNNHPKARPQSGLSQADVIYELLAEGEITRLLAVYQSNYPTVVGPVRSARGYFIDIANSYQSIYIAHGYSPEAQEMLFGGEIDHLNGIQYDGSLFHRAESRVAPHNSYITFKNIMQGANKLGYNMEGAPASYAFFSNDEETKTGNVSSFTVNYYHNPSYTATYQYESGKYERSVKGEKTFDLESNSEVKLSNVLVVEVPHKIIDSVGRRELNLTGGGKALLFQNSQKLEVTWKYENGQIVPYNGEEQAKLVPGKTWISIIPTNPGISEMVSY